MSQATQAQGLHEKGVQLFEEARTALTDLHAKREKGELSAEALVTEEARVHDLAGDAERFLKTARGLSDLDKGSAELDQLGSQPAYVRPMDDGAAGAGNPPDALQPGARGAHQLAGAQFFNGGMSNRQIIHCSRMAGVAPNRFTMLAGSDRSLVDRHLRSKKPSLAHLAPTREELAYLANPTGAKLEQLNVNPYIDADGGGLTAADIRNEVIGFLRETPHIRARARVIPTNAGTVTFPTMKLRLKLKKTRAHKGKVDLSEAKSIRDIIGKTEFTPHGRMETIKVPEELFEDMQFNLIGFVSEEIALEAFEDEERLFLVGTGVSEPFGVLTAPIFGVPHTGASAALFKPEDIKLLPFELRAIHRAGAVWMANRSFYKKVTVMRDDSAGAGTGTGQFLFQPGLRAGDPMTLIGFETLESEFFPDHIDGTEGATQNEGDPMCLLGQWKHYWIIERLSLEIRLLDQIFAEQGQIGVRYRKRLDAAPVRLEPWVTLDRKA